MTNDSVEQHWRFMAFSFVKKGMVKYIVQYYKALPADWEWVSADTFAQKQPWKRSSVTCCAGILAIAQSQGESTSTVKQ